MRRLACLVALALVVPSAAGCTSSGGGNSAGDFQGEEQRVASTVEDLQEAGSRGDQDAVCSTILAKALVDRLEARPGGCRTVVDEALQDTDTSDLTVRGVQIDGNRATVRATTDVGSAPDETTTLQLVREGGRWKISSLG